MGTDMYAVSERKKNGKWVLGNEIEVERNYKMFWVLAQFNRRENTFPVSVPPRGFPKDAGPDTRDALYGDYSYSYFTLGELRILLQAIEANYQVLVAYLTEKDYKEALAMIANGQYPKGLFDWGSLREGVSKYELKIPGKVSLAHVGVTKLIESLIDEYRLSGQDNDGNVFDPESYRIVFNFG